MAKFKKGDTIEAISSGRGFEKATVLSIFKGTKGRFKGKELYHLQIINGVATIPTSAEVNYRLAEDKR